MARRESIVIEGGVIKGATPNGIVEHLIKDKSDIETLDHFFAAFPQFVEAKVIWDVWNSKVPSKGELKEEYNPLVFSSLYGTPAAQTTMDPVKFREPRDSVINFLWAWVERSFHRDFLQTKAKRQTMFEDLLKFLSQLHPEASNRFKVLMLKAAAERRRRLRQVKLRSGSGAVAPLRSSSTSSLNQSPSGTPPGTLQPAQSMALGLALKELSSAAAGPPPSPIKQERKALEPGKFDFIDLDPMEVAHHLTLIEFEIFRYIQESELYNLGWKTENPKRLKMSPNVVKLVDRFNNVSFWVATEIVMVQNMRDRITVLRKFITVAEYLKDMNNFNGVMEIIGGLNMWAVQRLKATWEQLPAQAVKSLEDLNNLMSSLQNYKNYRATLKASKLPVLPYLGVNLRDLVFIGENENAYGAKEQGMFNFEKLKMVGGVIADIKRYQSSDYVFDRSDILNEYLTKLLTLPEEMLFKHSQLCEPPTRDSQ